jgi:hypothetical protein
MMIAMQIVTPQKHIRTLCYRKQSKNFSPAQKGFLESIVRGEVLVRQESMAGAAFLPVVRNGFMIC